MNLRAAGPGWLFCPADRPERFAKAAAAADVVILDLEDGVAEAQKPAARNALRDTPLDPERTVVRINAGGTADQARDLEALAGTAYTTVMLPKAESAAQVIELAPRDVIALVETARGAVCAAEIAASRCSDWVFIVSVVNNTLSASVTVRPGRCRYVVPIWNSSNHKPR